MRTRCWGLWKALTVALILATLPAIASATPVCEYQLNDCIHDAETEYTACIQEPQPPWQCEGEYNVSRDTCNAQYHECEEQNATCTPCSASNYTTNSAYCDDPPVTDACGCCERSNSPIVIDLSGNGFAFSCADNGVAFAISGQGLPAKWVAWPDSNDDAWLVWDRNGNGLIGDASEMFGNATPCLTGGLCENGYVALAELDDDGNGWIDRGDFHFSDLRLWVDANRNGLSEPWELQSLDSAGIVALDLEYRESRRIDRWGNDFRYMSRVRIARSQGAGFRRSSDVYLTTKPMSQGPPSGQCRAHK
jgi:hypothetical protein